MLQSAPIICLASIDWQFNWQVPQEVAAAFARAGHRVLFVENTGVRRPGLKDAPRVRVRAWNWWRSRHGIRRVADNLDVCSPLIVPFPYSRAACEVNARAMLRTIQRWLGTHAGPAPIVVTFLPTPLARAVIRGLDPALTVYYRADRLEDSSPAAQPIRDHDRALIADADLVLATSSNLLTDVTPLTSRAALLSAGVRCDDFEQARDRARGRRRGESDDEPAVLRGLTGPIVGYVGSLRDEVDRPLLARVARLAPDLTFALAGPIVTDVRELTACPNVRLLGPVSHADAVRCMIRFDVGIIPYVLNGYTAHLMPVKLKEYLAAGLPVVATHLPEVRRFVAEHGPLVSLADDAEQFVAALRDAVTDHGPAAVAKRVAVARRYDWSDRMMRMRELMEDALAARHGTLRPIARAAR